METEAKISNERWAAMNLAKFNPPRNGVTAEQLVVTPDTVREYYPITEKQTRKIAILGRAPSTVMQAPFDDPTWEIWSLGNAIVLEGDTGAQKGVPQFPRWDVWFELHDLDAKREGWSKEYWDWLGQDHGKPIWISQPHAHMPHARIYPWQQVFAKFGRYFNNSISELMALALLEGATELALYGVDMAQSDAALHDGNPEYQHQRPSCEHMVGFARGMGVPVFIPDASDLCKTPRIYAFQSDEAKSNVKLTARLRELRDRQKQALDQINAHEAQIKHHQEQKFEWAKIHAKFSGAIEDCDYWSQRL